MSDTEDDPEAKDSTQIILALMDGSEYDSESEQEEIKVCFFYVK